MAPYVLVADDESEFRDGLAEVLKEVGYRVAVAADGREALDLMEREQPAALVLDLAMPRLSGWEVLRILRAERPELPVVLATGADRPTPPEGVRAVLEKPFRIGALLAALATSAAGARG